ncbi:hypothetical protein KCU76_g16, partial [Aureobasidium melanogenum]
MAMASEPFDPVVEDDLALERLGYKQVYTCWVLASALSVAGVPFLAFSSSVQIWQWHSVWQRCAQHIQLLGGSIHGLRS